MFRSLGARISVVHISYLVLLALVVSSTTLVLERQKNDGLLVNLSGRQRMLTQRMTHQLLGFSAQTEAGRDTQVQRAAVIRSMQVFEQTLNALHRGGLAPLDLQMANLRPTPPASVVVAEQLQRVTSLYSPYKVHAGAILSGSKTKRLAGVSYVIENNTELLSEMNTAVSLMQAEVESRVQLLNYLQVAAMGLGLVLALLLSLLTRRTVVEPLRELNRVSDAMSRGDVNRQIRVAGPTEIHQLGSSFERLRVAMKNLLGAPSRADTGL